MQVTLMLLLISTKCPAIEVYYTDLHDVDEDRMTILEQGGPWRFGDVAGVTRRAVTDDPSSTVDSVASLKNKNSLSRY